MTDRMQLNIEKTDKNDVSPVNILANIDINSDKAITIKIHFISFVDLTCKIFGRFNEI